MRKRKMVLAFLFRDGDEEGEEKKKLKFF